MLRKEQNDLLTQTGPGTPMGKLFRSYWMPALLAEELPENECPPVRVKLLSERLLAFRDTDGRYGLIDEFCAHRGVSLWFGRNEECGIRCPYHGWKYDVTGQCVDVPSEPEESGFCQEDQAEGLSAGQDRRRAVDLHGAAGKQPPHPGMGVRPRSAASRRSRRSACRNATGCRRWRAASTSSHVSLLHSRQPRPDPLFKGSKGNEYNIGDMAARLRGRGAAGRPLHRRPPQSRERQVLLAHHALGDAELHHGAAARRPPDARPLLDPDRRRELLGLEL